MKLILISLMGNVFFTLGFPLISYTILEAMRTFDVRASAAPFDRPLTKWVLFLNLIDESMLQLQIYLLPAKRGVAV